ncbi:MAG: L,D-transpeptidase family protein [Methyloprofundus sp.]|nr:L,D-transpeptidase family protein [Methyloprofundus sp.]
MRYFIFLFIFFCDSLSHAQGAVWLLVDTQKKIIQVKQDEKTLETFKHVSIGRKGAGYKQQVGDGVTPIGTYKISYTNNESHFRKFFALNYPSADDAGLALFAARISYTDYQAIMQAHKNNQEPPQNTALGGLIGIHGLGNGNKTVHGAFDWTRGCVALSNQQIDRLAKWVYKGMRVQIK